MKYTTFHIQTHDNERLVARFWPASHSPKAAVCILHGFSDHSLRYAHVGEMLSTAGYSVVIADLRGHGDSSGRRGHIPSYEQFLADVDLLLQRTKQQTNCDRVFLYGHSLGGGLALRYALESDETLEGVIATSPWVKIRKPPPKFVFWLLRAVLLVWPNANGAPRPYDLEKDMTPEKLVLSHDMFAENAFRRDPHSHRRMSVKLLLGAVDNGHCILEQAPMINFPLLLMHGTDDKLTSYEATEEFSKKVPNRFLTFYTWADAYHELHNESNKEDILATVIDWLDTQVAIPNEHE